MDDPPPPPRKPSSSSSSSGAASREKTDDPAPPSRRDRSASNPREREKPGGQPVKGEESWRETQKKNLVSKHQDPCKFPAEQVRLCMDMNDFDQTKCQAYFQAYRECKDTWTKRNGGGITAGTFF